MVIRSQRHAVFFSGDTGLTTQYEAIRERLGSFDRLVSDRLDQGDNLSNPTLFGFNGGGISIFSF